MSNTIDYVRYKEIFEQNQRYIGYLQRIVHDQDITPAQFTELMNYAARLRATAKANEPQLLGLLPALEALKLAKNNFDASKKQFAQSLKKENESIQQVDQKFMEYRQALTKSDNLRLHDKPFTQRHTIFNFDTHIPDPAALIQEQQLINQNFEKQKASLGAMLLTSPLNHDIPANQAKEITKCRAEFKMAKKELEEAEERLVNDPSFALQVKNCKKNYNEKLDRLIELVVTNSPVEWTQERTKERNQLDSLLNKAKSERTPEALAELKEMQQDYLKKYKASAFLDDAIIRYKKASEDQNCAEKAVAASRENNQLNKAAAATRQDNSTFTFKELDQTKAKVKSSIEKALPILKKRSSLYDTLYKWGKELYMKKMQKHQNVIDTMETMKSKKGK